MTYDPNAEMVYFNYVTAFNPELLDSKLIAEIVPKCKCHGINMRWYINRRKKHGGEFRCPIKRRASQNRYNAKRYMKDQLYRTTDVVRKKRKRREDAIFSGAELLAQLESTRGEVH